MIIDTSALMAIFQNEPEGSEFLESIESVDSIKISSATVFEASIVMQSRYGPDSVDALHEFLFEISAEEVAFTAEHRREAENGFAIFGKGQEHRAQLNFGDCLTYGLAKVAGEPILCKGDDFIHTDAELVHR